MSSRIKPVFPPPFFCKFVFDVSIPHPFDPYQRAIFRQSLELFQKMWVICGRTADALTIPPFSACPMPETDGHSERGNPICLFFSGVDLINGPFQIIRHRFDNFTLTETEGSGKLTRPHFFSSFSALQPTARSICAESLDDGMPKYLAPL